MTYLEYLEELEKVVAKAIKDIHELCIQVDLVVSQGLDEQKGVNE